MSTSPHARSHRFLTMFAMALVLVVVVSSFGLSFTVLRDLAALSGIPGPVAWLWPVIVDGTITAATLVVYTSRSKAERQTLPLATLIVFGLASITGNVAHIVLVSPSAAVPAAIAVFIGVMPPVGLIMTVELLGNLLRSRSGATVSNANGERREAAVATGNAASVLGPTNGKTVGNTGNPPVAAGGGVVAATATVEAFASTAAAPVTAGDTALATGKHAAEASGEAVFATAKAPAADSAAVGNLAVTATGDGSVTALMAAATGTAASGERNLATGNEAVAATGATPLSDQPLATEDRPLSAEAPSRPRLHTVEALPLLPTTPAEQVDWVLERARSGHDVTWVAVADMLRLSDRQAQRRLTEARKQDPDAFAA